MKLLKIFSVVLFAQMFVLLTKVEGQNKTQNTSPAVSYTQSKETDAFLERLKKQEHINILQGALWTVTHDYADFKHMEEILKSFQNYFDAIGKYEKGDASALKQVGGIKSFKDALSLWLKDEDQAIRAFAAVILGISGDKSYSQQVSALLKDRKTTGDELSVYDRGRAAIALGLMGAKEFTPQIVSLLQSKNDYDRSGAVTALGYFGAKEYAPQIANLLTNKDFLFEDDPSPIYFLVETETAGNYKNELVQVMLSQFRVESQEAAMYALVHLAAKEKAKDIAKLLSDESRRGDAAKALALLDVKEYSNEIASLLTDEKSLVRKDAALALGILKAKNHSGKIANLLKANEDFVRYYAAVSLILMQATEYYKEAIPIIEKSHQSGGYLNDEDFHPLVLDKSHQINANFKQLLEQAKSSN